MDARERLNLLKKPICRIYSHDEWDDSEREVIPNDELFLPWSKCNDTLSRDSVNDGRGYSQKMRNTRNESRKRDCPVEKN